MTPARTRSHSASNPMCPVVTSPSIVTSSTSASNPLIETRPHVVKAGSAASPPPDERWNALRSRRSSPVSVRAASSRWIFVAHSGRPNGSSVSASGTAPGAPVRRIPPTVTCDGAPPSRRSPSASTTCEPTVRPNRTIHARGIWSVFSIVPVATPSAITAPDAAESRSVSVSSPSSWASSRTGTETVFSVSPGAKVSSPLRAV